MSGMKIKWRIAGFAELRKSGEVQADLAARAERVAAASGEGFAARSGVGKTRARAAVVTIGHPAIRRPNDMLANLDRGR